MQHPNHPDHDLSLIAAHAAGDLIGSERSRGEALLAACKECADVHRDLITIAAATRALPNLATAPRDYRLSQEQAARLHRGSWLRTILGPFGATRSATRPIAAAFTSVGIAGLLVATILPGMLGQAVSAPTSGERDQAAIGAEASAGPAAAPAATEAALGPVSGSGGEPAPNPTSGDVALGVKDGTTATLAPEFGAVDGLNYETPSTQSENLGRLSEPTPPNLVVIGSLALLAVGVLLFGLRSAGRRLR
ncbi:MAG: hypothetical protein ABIZ52_00590 [Candidatus Limnocylindrales bacterium]